MNDGLLWTVRWERERLDWQSSPAQMDDHGTDQG